jgi:ribosome-associated toxin RatA of RatAB toxin-antitoxin module
MVRSSCCSDSGAAAALTCVRGVVALFCVAAVATGLVRPARSAEQLLVQAESRGSSVTIEARATLNASLPVVWSTLTDYDHLASFIPGMSQSRVVERHGSIATVEQRGEFRFMFFRFPIEVVIAAEEHYPFAIDARSVKGNIKLLSAEYRLQRTANGDRCVLHWIGVVQPEFWTPMFVTVSLLRENVEDQFRAMVQEIERREALRPRSER